MVTRRVVPGLRLDAILALDPLLRRRTSEDGARGFASGSWEKQIVSLVSPLEPSAGGSRVRA